MWYKHKLAPFYRSDLATTLIKLPLDPPKSPAFTEVEKIQKDFNEIKDQAINFQKNILKALLPHYCPYTKRPDLEC